MKRIVALLLSMIMLMGCFAFAENAETEAAAQQTFMEELLTNAGVEYKDSDMAANLLELLHSATIKAHSEFISLTGEQFAEWNEVRHTIYTAALETTEGGGDELVAMINSTIDNMQTVGVVAKASMKSSIFEDLSASKKLNETERVAYKLALQAIYDAMIAAGEDGVEEVYDELMADFQQMSFGMHDVRDNLIMLFHHVSSYSDLLHSAIAAGGEEASDLANAYLYVYARHNNPLPEGESEIASVILSELDEQIHGLGYDLTNLTEKQDAVIRALIAEKVASNFPSLSEEQLAKFEDYIYRANNKYHGMSNDKMAILRQMTEALVELLEDGDEEVAADVAAHMAAMQTALAENDSETLINELELLFGHVNEHRTHKIISAIYNMSEEEAELIAVKLLFTSSMWGHGEVLTDNVFATLSETGIDWTNPSDEDLQTVTAMLEEMVESAEVPEGYEDTYLEYLLDSMFIIGNFTEDETEAYNVLTNSVMMYLQLSDEGSRASINPLLERIAIEMTPDNVSNQENIYGAISVVFGDETEARHDTLHNMSETAKMMVVRIIMEEIEAYMSMPVAYGKLFAEVNTKVYNIADQFEINGAETDPAVIAELEAKVYEAFKPHLLSPIDNAAVCSRQVARILIFSMFDAEEEDLVLSVISNIDGILARSDEAEIDALMGLYHALLHAEEESKFN